MQMPFVHILWEQVAHYVVGNVQLCKGVLALHAKVARSNLVKKRLNGRHD